MALNILIMCCRAKQRAAEIAARKAAKGARRPAAAVATSAPHAAPGPSSANGRAVSTAPPPALTACPPPGFGNKGGNGGSTCTGISGHDNGRRCGYGDDAATKQLAQLPFTPEERPGLPVPWPAQSSAPGAHIPILAGQGVQ